MKDEAELRQLRYDCLLKITRTMGGVALSGAVQAPTLEIAKQLGISISDAWLCFDIYKSYFGKELKKGDLARMLGTTGAIVLGGGVAGYIGIRLAQALLREILDELPIAKSIVTGVAFGSSTFLIGVAWLAIVERQYILQESGDA